MTRINVVEPEHLVNKHLLAEYRELPRIFTLVENYHNKHNRLYTCNNNGDYIVKANPFYIMPIETTKPYTLGTGHVRFFYNKLNFLYIRHALIVIELVKRGYKLNINKLEIKDCLLDKAYWGDYIPTQEAIELNKARLIERLKTMRLNNEDHERLQRFGYEI